jgi:hypothetical protein
MTSNSEVGGNRGCYVVPLEVYDNYEEWMRYSPHLHHGSSDKMTLERGGMM